MSKYIGATAVNLSTTSADVTGNATIGGNLTVQGTTITIDSATAQTVDLGDNDKIRLGDGDDLQIYHNGSHSYIDDAGTGNLYIRAADNLYLQKYTGETFLQATADGEVRITHNNSTKLATTATGVDVTGTVTADQFHHEGSNGVLLSAGSGTDTAVLANGWTSGIGDWVTLQVPSVDDEGGLMRLGSDGNFYLYDDTGTTAKLFWNASAEFLGLGTTSPGTNLHVYHATRNNVAVFESGDADVSVYLRDSNSTSISAVGIGATTDDLTLRAGNAEAMRIDSSGNLLVGTTDTSLYNNSGSGEGMSYFPGQFLTVATSGQETAIFNRLSSDGTILQFRKDGSTVGTIGSNGGDVYIGNPDESLIRFGNNQIAPASNTGADRDNAIDIGGTGGRRFKDLYLSGGLHVGGTGSANYLDDYETGIHTLAPVYSNVTIHSTYVRRRYTKIGNLVTMSVYVQVTSESGTEPFRLTLPFTAAASPTNGTNTSAGGVMHENVNCGSAGLVYYINSDSAEMRFYRVDNDGTAWDELRNSDLQVSGNNSAMYCTVTYISS